MKILRSPNLIWHGFVKWRYASQYTEILWGVQYVSEVLLFYVEIKIKVIDLHCSGIKRTVKIYSNTLHVYVCTNGRTEEEHVNIYWVTLTKIEGNRIWYWKHWTALFEGMILEEALYLSWDKLCHERIVINLKQDKTTRRIEESWNKSVISAGYHITSHEVVIRRNNDSAPPPQIKPLCYTVSRFLA